MDDFRSEIAQHARRQRAAAASFARAVVASDLHAVAEVVDELAIAGAWRPALRRVFDADPTDDFRAGFVGVWVAAGDSLRDEVDDDRLVLRALRALLPRYRGTQSVVLYRGESVFAWRRRRHGMAWTSDIAVARAFAELNRKMTADGGVILRCLAPPGAVISEIHPDDDRYAESEFIIDRRLIGRPTLIERLTPDPSVARGG